jgi:anti-sigma B factor antagonist
MLERPEQRVLDVERVGGLTFARVTRRRLWDQDEAQALGRELVELLEQGGHPRLVVSLAGAEEVSSATLGKLIAVHRRVEALGGRLTLCHINPHLYEGLDVARLTQFFHVYSNEQEAALSFGAPHQATGGVP